MHNMPMTYVVFLIHPQANHEENINKVEMQLLYSMQNRIKSINKYMYKNMVTNFNVWTH